MARNSSGRASKKIFHKIGEVCEITKTEPYVLRYWESEFPFLAPEKNRAGQRIYTDEDIQTVLAIKRLLYEEGYTTAGARRKLELERREGPSGGAAAAAESAPAPAPATPQPDAPQGVTEEAAEAAPDAGDEEAEALRAALRRLRGELTDLRNLLEG